MLVYRDRSWCSSSDECKNEKCNSRLTDKDRTKATLWWGGSDYPLAMMDMKDTDYCVGFIPKDKK
jgi:hypothetical protein